MKADNSPMKIVEKRSRGMPRRQWMDSIYNDMIEVGVEREDIDDRRKWIRMCHQEDSMPGKR